MKFRCFFLIICIFSIASHAAAQVYTIDFNNKVVKTDGLNMPPNTSVYSIIAMIPEMLQRSGVGYLENYEVKINGMSVGDVSDVALHQLQIVDVDKIEISESSTSGYTKNGQAGSINIVLRDKPAEGKKLWGSLGLSASYPLDLAPQGLIGYSDGKFKVRGVLQ